MIRAYRQPEELDAALRLIADGATPVAGATALYTARAKRNIDLVDVTRLGLNKIIVEPKRVVIDAGVTFSQVVEASNIPGMEGAVLRKVCRSAASRPLRNMITIGGNIAHLVYWADLPVALLALDASVEVQKAGATTRIIPISECIEPGKHPFAGGLITSIIVPLRDGLWGFGYERFCRTEGEYSLGTVCTTFKLGEGKKVEQAHIVVGAVQNRPQRITEAETLLNGTVAQPACIERIAERLVASVTFAPNYRASLEYRRSLLTALTRRSVATAYAWATRED
jgi:CO/xanthine dehydrogenase FAD-binding subunit